jgi:sugar phosphate isomerase/epimerase
MLAGHTNTYHTYSLDEALAGIAAAGYGQVELSAVPGWTEHVDLGTPPGQIQSRLAGHGLQAVALSAHSDLTTDEGVAYALRAIGWAADYGLDLVTTAIGGHASREESQEEFLPRAGRIASAAEQAGVIVALEIHGDLMATGQAARPLIERIGSPAIRLKYDTANVEYYGGERAVDDLPSVVDLVVNLDLKDKLGGRGEWNFPPPGDGHIDWASLLGTLDQAGYRGPMAVELEFLGEPWPPLPEVTAALRSAREYLLSTMSGS